MASVLISIITPSFGSERFISQTIESVLAQSLSSWEMIIIDDCSPDRSNQVIEQYLAHDERIKLIKLDKNRGPAIARNHGITHARGKYIAFLDSDDLWHPEKLAKQVKFMEQERLVVTCSAYHTITAEGFKLNTRSVLDLLTYDDMVKSNHIGNLTGIYDCHALGKIYSEERGHEDYTLWLKIMGKVGSTKTLNEPLASYRVSQKSISANKVKAIRWQWGIYRDFLGFGRMKSVYCFSWYVFYAIKKRL